MTFRQEIRKVLTHHWLQRKKVQFPLYPIDTWDQFKLPEDMEYDDILVARSMFQQAPDTEDPMFRLYRKFPAMRKVLDTHHGKLVLAGGFFTPKEGHVAGHDVRDLDFFIHGVDADEATRIVSSCVEIIVGTSHSEYRHRSMDCTVVRTMHVTSIIFHEFETYEGTIKYSFIHRLYPTMDSITGGFDLGPSMVLYDGKQIYATRMGAFSLVNKLVIADVSTRSTTYARRIKKYVKNGFKGVFPGAVYPDHQIGGPSHGDRLREVYEFAKSKGLRWRLTGDTYGPDQFWDTMREQLPEDEYAKMADFKFNERHGDGDICLRLGCGPKNIEGPVETDYSDGAPYFDFFGESNWSSLIHDKLSTIIVGRHIVASELDELDITEMWHDLLLKPVIEVNYEITSEPTPYDDQVTKHRWAEFSEIAISMNQGRYTIGEATLAALAKILKARADALIPSYTEKMTGITWIDKNPQRQWTAAFNPRDIAIDVYYGQMYGPLNGRAPFMIGIDLEVIFVLEAARLQKDNVWHLLSKDMYDMICGMIALNTTY